MAESHRAAKAERVELAMDYQYDPGFNDPTEMVKDVLTDLRHYCDCNHLDFSKLNRLAELNYEEDLEDD